MVISRLCWLLGSIRPGNAPMPRQSLTALQTPSEWRLLTPGSDQKLFRDMPVVVHLSGCPLLNLPKLDGGDLSAKSLVADLTTAGIDIEGIQLSHAVMVDEYLALRQSEAELFWLSTVGTSGPSRALPSVLTDDGERNRRFWMTIGVPIADSAVRHRVVSQMTLRRLQAAFGGVDQGEAAEPDAEQVLDPLTGFPLRRPTAAARSDVDGLVVNLRVNDDEASLLYWVGLDVVEADCSDFAGDLVHYAVHVREGGRLKRPEPTERCGLEQGLGE